MDRRELLKTHHRDPKTGRIIKKTPYRAVFQKGKPTVFIKDGNHYYEDGTPVDPQWEIKEAEELLKAAQSKLDAVKSKAVVEKEKTAVVKENKNVKRSTTVDSEGLRRKGQDESSKPGFGTAVRDI